MNTIRTVVLLRSIRSAQNQNFATGGTQQHQQLLYRGDADNGPPTVNAGKWQKLTSSDRAENREPVSRDHPPGFDTDNKDEWMVSTAPFTFPKEKKSDPWLQACSLLPMVVLQRFLGVINITRGSTSVPGTTSGRPSGLLSSSDAEGMLVATKAGVERSLTNMRASGIDLNGEATAAAAGFKWSKYIYGDDGDDADVINRHQKKTDRYAWLVFPFRLAPYVTTVAKKML